MTPKQARDRLFRQSRPHARRILLITPDGSFTKEASLFWAAFKAGSFDLDPATTQEDFAQALALIQHKYSELYLMEDENSSHPAIAFVGVKRDGVALQLEASAFKWATPKNLLRAAVAFLNMQRHSTKCGVCLVKGEKKFLGRLTKYGVLFYVGPVSKTEHLFSVRGRFGE